MSGNKIAVGFKRPEPAYTGMAVGTKTPAPRYTEKGVVSTQGPQGPQGDPGPQGTAAGYNHDQASPSDEWIINHNLGYRPSVEVFSVGGLEILAEVQHPTVNQTRVLHVVPTAGSARLV